MRLTWVALVAFGLLPGFAFSQAGEDARLQKAALIVAEYSKVLEGLPAEAKYNIANREFLQHLAEKNIALRVSDAPCKSLLSSLALDVNWETGQCWITMNEAAVRMYPEDQSIVFSMLTHEYWHYYSYLHYRDQFRSYRTDPFEEVMYEADSYYLEAKFINEVLIPKHFSISRFEDYLAKCGRSGTLGSFTALFTGTDSTIVDQLYAIRSDLQSGSIDQDALYKKSVAVGHSIINDFEGAAQPLQDWEKMFQSIDCGTFRRFLRTLIDQTEKVRKTYGDIFKEFPDLKTVLDRMDSLIESDATQVNEYRKKLLSTYDLPCK